MSGCHARLQTRLLWLNATLVLAACGIDQGGAPLQPTGPVAAGTELLLLVGTVTATDPLTVNGQPLDTSATAVLVDAAAGSVSDLAVGQIVSVIGQSDNGNAQALSIVYQQNLRGPVSQIDTGAGAFTVLGQTVVAGAGLSVPVTADISGLQVDDRVDVSGFTRPDGAVLATFIGTPRAAAADGITGVAGNVDTVAMAFSIGALRVDYSAATVMNDLPGGEPQEGQVVRVEGTTGPSGLTLAATSLSAPSGLPAAVLASDLAGLQPDATMTTATRVLIAGFAGAPDTDRFLLDEAIVVFDDTTVFVGGDPSMLVGAPLVQVDGRLAADGSVTASQITLL